MTDEPTYQTPEDLPLYYTSITRFLRYNYTPVHSIHTIEDLVQETYLQAYISVRNNRPPTEYPYAWLCSVARRTAALQLKNERERRRHRNALGESYVRDDATAPNGDVLDSLADDELLRRLHAALRKLDSKVLSLVEQYYIDGRSCREIAGHEGRTTQGVKVALYRARKRLATLLRRPLHGEDTP